MLNEEIKIEKPPAIMNAKVAELIRYHLKKEKIVYILEESDNSTIYMLKSIKRDSQTYNVVNENGTWTCDCPAFKYRRRFGKELCKHIDFIQVLIKEEIPIESI